MTSIERLRKICFALPEAIEKPFGGHTAPTFRVRDKIFVMSSEAGNGAELSFTCKAPPGAQGVLVGGDPKRFFVPRYVGPKGWIGVRLNGRIDWAPITSLVEDSYRMAAPKRLLARLP